MEIDVTTLARAEDGTAQDVSLAEPSPELADLDVTDLALSGSLSQLGDRLVLTGQVSATASLICARCLVPFRLLLTVLLADEFAESPSEEQYPLGQDRLDPAPAIRSALLLEIPPRPLHDSDCHGLCPTCGQDLNQEPHTHDHPTVDHPFAALAKLKSKDTSD